jgi:hypothetical protein
MPKNLIRCLIAGSAVVAACSGLPSAPTARPPTPLTVALRSDAWQTIADPDPFPLSNNAGSELTFEFPVTGSMHYLFTASTLTEIRGTVAVTLRVATTGPVVFNSLDPLSSACSIPPSVRPFFWANQNGNGQYDRWWSNPRAFPLAPGSTTLAVPLTPESWSSVNGRFGNADSEARFGFDKALLNVTRLGLTFGGGCSFGHGITVQGGRAEFFLTQYAIR